MQCIGLKSKILFSFFFFQCYLFIYLFIYGDGVQDEFPDAQLFRVTAENTVDETVADKDKWLTNSHHFQSSGLPPEELNETSGNGWWYKAVTFVYYRTRYTIKEPTEFGDVRSEATKKM